VPGTHPPIRSRFHSGQPRTAWPEVLTRGRVDECQLVDVPLVSISRRDGRSACECLDAGKPAPNMLLRKEVIQPHLPVRLPCYDLVPIASPTFDGSFP
jgi:hypothetical protein